MQEQSGYGQFCPVAMAAEILCSRWTVLVVRELLCGSTHFNELRRGVPRMSPSLLSKRLKELQRAGIVEAVRSRSEKTVQYRLTQAGQELREIVMGMGSWAQRWVDSKLTLKKLDPALLMWDMRRRLDPGPLPARRCTLKFHFRDASQGQKDWWLVIAGGAVDLCGFDPGFDIDLYITATLKALTSVWMGLSSLKQEMAGGQLELLGDRRVASAMEEWLGLSVFAKKQLAA